MTAGGFPRVLRRMLTGNLSFRELVRRTWKELGDDMVPARAAELAYYFTMSFFPLLICLITLLTLIPGTDTFLFDYLDALLPREAAGVVHGWVRTVFRAGSGGLLSLSLVFTLWSASAGVAITAGTPQDFATRNVGVELRVVPTVEEDDRSISLDLNPRVTEFEGFIGRETPVPDAVCFRIDFPRFFATLTQRQRDMAEDLMSGMSTNEVAAKHAITPGAVSQFRTRFYLLWRQFSDEA